MRASPGASGLLGVFEMHGLRSYLDELETRGHIIRITKPVDVGHELAAIQWQVEREMYKGVIFENVRGYDAKVVVDLDGTPLHFIDLANLIANKQATGRPQDLADVDNLQP